MGLFRPNRNSPVTHDCRLFSRGPEIKKDVIDNAAGGAQNLGSVARVARTGHLVSLLSTELPLCSSTP